MQPISTCPTSEMLRSYLAGKLDDVWMDEIGLHLDHCTHCTDTARRIEQDEPDTLTKRLKGLETLSQSLKAPELETKPDDHSQTNDAIDMPDSIGVYKIEKILGHGGMGVVYEGVHPHLKRRVAVKVVKPKHRFNPDMQARFQRELEAVGQQHEAGCLAAATAGSRPDFQGRITLSIRVRNEKRNRRRIECRRGTN